MVLLEETVAVPASSARLRSWPERLHVLNLTQSQSRTPGGSPQPLQHACMLARPVAVPGLFSSPACQGCRDHACSHARWQSPSPHPLQHACMLVILHNPNPALPVAVPSLFS